MKRLVWFLILLGLFSNPAIAQEQKAPLDWFVKGCWDFPCLSNPRLNGIIHDGLHSFTAIAVAEGLGTVTEWPESTRYLIGAVALPIAQEIYDSIKFGSGIKHFTKLDGFHDPFTYQGAWILPLIRNHKYWQAATVSVVYGGFLYWYHYQR